MSLRRAWVAAALGLGIAACSSDLFHSTDWETLCATHPTPKGCPGAAQGAGGSTSSSSSSSSSGMGGGSSSSSSSSSSGGACMHCYELITQANLSGGCSGQTQTLLAAVLACLCGAAVCGQECAAQCSGASDAGAVSQACQTCAMGAATGACQTQFNACVVDK